MTRQVRIVRVPLYALVVGAVVTLLSPLVAILASTAISKRALDESNAKWCTVVVAQSDAYRETPPKTPVGKNIAKALDDLRGGLGCG